MQSINVLRIRCDIISREIQNWRSVCSYVTEYAKRLTSAEINNLTYHLCRRKQVEITNFLGVVKSHRKAIEALYDRCTDFRRMLMQHDCNVLLEKILEEELHLFDMLHYLGDAQLCLLQHNTYVKLQEISLKL
ncbi:hypothetical protein CEXT_572871 [Caerostris extrusa]|uniref:Uncharacterized protein n=1 Tax=Caerostris extrusa TaxID=172846 RepID=A0AAV4WQE6_CAEEX|nr:hypothetical protein CEXT_572871 [Caerostris extrusa]